MTAGGSIGSETFTIDRSFARMLPICIAIFGAFAILFLALPFLDEPRPALFAVQAFGLLLFGGLGTFCAHTLRRLPCFAVTVDRDGLWPAHLPRVRGLVPWHSVRSLRERPALQRLELLDHAGAVLLRLEYQLAGFERLRALVVERVPRAHLRPLVPATFGKPLAYHVLNLGGIAGFAALGLYVAQQRPWLGYGTAALVAGMVLWEYLSTVSRLFVSAQTIEVGYPLRTLTLPRADIERVEIGDTFQKGSRIPEVRLVVRGRPKPIRLAGLGRDATTLYQALAQVIGADARR